MEAATKETGTRHKIPRMKATGQPSRQPNSQPDTVQTTVDSTRAAQFLGVTEDAIRKRIARGTLEGYKEGGKWFVRLPDSDQKVDRIGVQNVQTDGKDEVITELRDRVASLETQISQKDHQLGEMLIVVRQTQAMLAAPARPWWKIWR